MRIRMQMHLHKQMQIKNINPHVKTSANAYANMQIQMRIGTQLQMQIQNKFKCPSPSPKMQMLVQMLIKKRGVRKPTRDRNLFRSGCTLSEFLHDLLKLLNFPTMNPSSLSRLTLVRLKGVVGKASQRANPERNKSREKPKYKCTSNIKEIVTKAQTHAHNTITIASKFKVK